VLGILGALWFLALVATLYKYPHTISRDELRVRHLSFLDFAVPVAKIESVRQSSQTVQTRSTVHRGEHGELAVLIANSTNLTVTLREPHLVDLGRKGPVEITQLAFWADEPREAVSAIRERLALAEETAAGTGGEIP
jgi:hypothetical protein